MSDRMFNIISAITRELDGKYGAQTYPYIESGQYQPMTRLETPFNPDAEMAQSLGLFGDDLDQNPIELNRESELSQSMQLMQDDLDREALADLRPDQQEQILGPGREAFAAVQGVRDNPDAAQDPGFLSSVKSFFGDEENMTRLALAFNSMRLNPDQGLATVLGDRLKSIDEERKERQDAIQKTEQTNKTIAFLQANYPEVADLVAAGLPVKDAMAAVKDPEKVSAYKYLLENPEQAAQLKELGVLGSGGVSVSVGAEDPMATERSKAVVNRFVAMSQAGEKSPQVISQLDALSAIGEAKDFNAIPGPIRGILPEGVSSTVDAYQAVARGVAQGLYAPGSGAQSDSDVALLISRAGSVSSDLESRRLVQQALREAAQRNQERANIANDYLEGRIDQAAASARIRELNSQGLMSDEMRSRLQALGAPTAQAGNAVTTPPPGAKVRSYADLMGAQ